MSKKKETITAVVGVEVVGRVSFYNNIFIVQLIINKTKRSKWIEDFSVQSVLQTSGAQRIKIWNKCILNEVGA